LNPYKAVDSIKKELHKYRNIEVLQSRFGKNK